MRRFFDKTVLLTKFYNFWVIYGSPANFSYWWNFGSMALICLIIQIATGIFLAMHYKSDLNLAFASVDYICKSVQYGWLIRYLHSNGASVFFLVVYLHMIRSLLFGSFNYPRQLLWGSGVIIFVLMIVTAFFGYVLPWGQMSYWAATVITSLFSAIPLIGNDIVLWLWGGFSVDDATLNRFFSLHFFFPFVILMLSIIHIMLLHEFGSNNPSGVFFRPDFTFMTPLYIIKDLFGTNFMFIFLAYLIFSVPNLLGHSDNYILGNPLVTPPHIVPEWYFLPLYAILRSVPDKLLGVITLALAILLLLFLPFFVNKFNMIRSNFFKPLYKPLMLLFVLDLLILGWIGGQPVSQPYLFIGQAATVFYFLLFFFFACSSIVEQYVLRFFYYFK